MSTRTLRGSILVTMMVFAGIAARAQEVTAQSQTPQVRYAAQFDRLMRGMEIGQTQRRPGDHRVDDLQSCAMQERVPEPRIFASYPLAG